MKESLKLLMIDDSRTIRDSYEIVVHRLQETFTVEYAIVGTADEALNRINFAAQSPYHIVCVDIELLHPSRDPSIISGEDLALRIKELQPKTKIIVITNHEKKERIRYIYNTLQPESLLIKLQAGFDDICWAITEVKNGYTFYSPLAEKIIRDIEKYKTEQQDILDTVDKHIIFYLNKHFTHAEISKKIGKSESTIEKRKRKMKSIFGLEEDSDANLLSHAKNIGFLDGFRE